MGDPHAIQLVDNLSDAVFFMRRQSRALNFEGAAAIGHSFGGMLALELAAAFPQLFSGLVVLDAIGLWDETRPVANWIAARPEELPAMLFKDPTRPAAQAFLTMPKEPEAAALAMEQIVWNIRATGKMIGPNSERGLHKRLHRVSAPTLIVWGEDDALIPASYAQTMSAHIPGSIVKIVADCGHIPQVEQSATTLDLVGDFLATIHARGFMPAA